MLGARRIAAGTAVTLVAAASLAAAAVPATQPVASGPAVRVIVQAVSGAAATADRLVAEMGGHITRNLPIINGFAATVPSGALARLRQSPAVVDVSPDAKMHVQGTVSSSNPDNLQSVYRQVVGAQALGNAGYQGQGVTVALVDTGVANLPDVAGAIVPVSTDPLGATTAPCENLSGDPGCGDSYGHGTFLAGLIAGNGAASGGQYVGVAPKTRIVSVKIAGADGSADVSNVLAAIQWVVSFKDTYGIRVLNLSLGTDSTQSYHVDPLDYAVEKAWQAGLVVVVAASNRGPAAGTISKPADDPFVLTVGATDDMGTPGLGDDTLPNFTGRGPTAADGLAKPDVVAPGAHLVSLAAPGASITTQFPSSMPAPYRRGSGTSMATAVVSGLVADMLSASPSMTPDRVKYALMSTARSDASTDPMAVGAGEVNGYNAVFNAPPGLANQGLTPAVGGGSLDASRGSVQVSALGSSGSLSLVSGNLTSQLTLWDPTTLYGSWSGSSWYGSSWYGSSWYDTSWTGSSWYGSSWYGSSWYGTPEGSSWYGSSWYGSSWYGAWDQ